MIYSLNGTPTNTPFPNPAQAESDPNGLLAVGGDLSVERLLSAYQQGIFPWYNEQQPILWWSPAPRTVIYPGQLHISRSLRRQMRHCHYVFKLDTAFSQVTQACAEPRADQEGTWLLPDMQAAYAKLHELGYAHSIELWNDQALIGGMYGVALGHVFFGESMFSRVPSASRMVMVFLTQLMQTHQMQLLDCQVSSPHLTRMGAVEIPREQFLHELSVGLTPDTAPDLWQTPPTSCATVLT